MSLVQRIAVTASAVITFAILAALLAYILIMGVPNLKPGPVCLALYVGQLSP